MNVNLNPNEYPSHRCLSRDTVSTEALECIELVALNVTRNKPRRTLSVYVLRDVDLTYGILDAFGVGSPHTSSREIQWFDNATSVEECITAFQAFLEETQRNLERTL